MKYGYTITRKDGTTEHGTITAMNTAAAHSVMNTAAGGEKYRIYPMNRALLALGIATATAKNAVMRQGTETQVQIDRDCRILSAMTAAAMAAGDMTGRDVTAYIMDRLPRFSHDMQDFFSVAMGGIEWAAENGHGIVTATAAGYKALNKYIYSMKTATEKELSTEYITSGGGDIVAINSAVSSIIRGGDKWIAAAGGGLTAEQAENLGAAIHGAAALLRPAQRDIIRLLGNGYSQRQIAQKTGRALSTIEKNIAIIRGIMAEYIAANYPEFVDVTTESTIDATAAQAAAQAAALDGRTESGAARHNMEAAARMRAYRARKRAAAQAAALLQ